MSSILYLKHNDIDQKKWDECILNSVNGNIYAWSWYLNLACPEWEALVCENYETVMPLPVRKKYGISYIYQPYFMQQLGVFSTNGLSPDILQKFIEALPTNIKFADYNLNFHNQPDGNKFKFIQNTTYHLDLISDYPVLIRNYTENTRRNIRKSEQHKISISKGMQVNTLIQFKQETAPGKMEPAEYDKLRHIVSKSIMKGAGEIYGAYTETNELCAAAFFAFSHQYSYMLVAASSETGKDLSAMFLLVNTFIREHSGKNITLDFEGSNIAGIARFFAGFGAMPVYYYKLRFNHLPFYFKWIKK